VRFSFIYGNPANPEWLSPDEYTTDVLVIDMIFVMLTALCPIIMLSTAVTVSLYSDFGCNWKMFIYSAPYSEKKIVGLKFAETVVSWVIGVAVGAIFNVIYCLIFGGDYIRLNMIIGVLISVVALIIELVSLAMIYKHKNQNTVMTRLVLCIAVPLYIIGAVSVFKIRDLVLAKYSGEQDILSVMMNDMFSYLSSHIVAVSVIILALTLGVGFAAYKKKHL
jgi:hypothetical protein